MEEGEKWERGQIASGVSFISFTPKERGCPILAR